MSALAPLDGPTTTTSFPGVSSVTAGANAPASSPGSPPATPPPKAGPNFTAFPSSYDGFGTNGGAFGTLGVVDGRLSVTTVPPQAPPAGDHAPPAPPEAVTRIVVTSADLTAAANNSYTAIPAGAVPDLAKTLEAGQTAANDNTAPGKTENGAKDSGPIPGTPPLVQAPLPGTPPPNPSAGLLGAPGPPPLPGGTPVENDPQLGLLGAPATNPIVIQAEKEQALAAEEANAAADEEAAARSAAQVQLEQVDARIAAARATGNQAAAAQLEPAAVKLTGQIQGQTFAGLGTTPPQPFARPEIPTVFLNVAS
jgi:hypothetical protein